MTKADVINEISDKTGIDKSDVQVTVEAFFFSCKKFNGAGREYLCQRFWKFYQQEEGSENSQKHFQEYSNSDRGTLCAEL